MAGTDSTGTFIAWIILCYLHYPEYHEPLQKEIEEVIGKVVHKILHNLHKAKFTLGAEALGKVFSERSFLTR